MPHAESLRSTQARCVKTGGAKPNCRNTYGIIRRMDGTVFWVRQNQGASSLQMPGLTSAFVGGFRLCGAVLTGCRPGPSLDGGSDARVPQFAVAVLQ